MTGLSPFPDDAILTWSGHLVRPFADDPGRLTIVDVAAGLSRICRFGGHCQPWYSVAEHSLLVSELLRPYGRFGMLRGLLHDAAEAYIGDVPTPLKRRLAVRDSRASWPLAEAENYLLSRILGAVVRTEDFMAMDSTVVREAVKTADVVALATERRFLMPRGEPWPVLEGVTPVQLLEGSPLSVEQAQIAFLQRFELLTSGREP